MTKTSTPIDSPNCQNAQCCQNVIFAGAHGDADAIQHIASCDLCNAESRRLHGLTTAFTEVNNLIYQAEHGDIGAYQKLTSDSRLAKIWQSLTSAYC